MTSHRLLLVDDDPDDIHFMKRAFSKISPEVTIEVATDGEMAIDHLSTVERPDFVLLDLRLPRKSGLEVLRWIRQNPGLSSLRVIVMSSSASDGDVRRAEAIGIDGCHLKPMAFGELLDLVRSLCARWGLPVVEAVNPKR